MIDLLLLAAAVQAEPATATQTCALLAPAGEAIVFSVVSGDGVNATLVPAEGSAWPTVSTAAVRPANAPDSALRYIVGGEDGVVLDVQLAMVATERRAPALLSRWSGRRGDLPLAFGFCVRGEASPPIAPAATAAATDIPAFNPNRWPDDCVLLGGDGRRLRLEYRGDSSAPAATIGSPTLWGGRTITVQVRRDADGSAGVFASANGARGTERTVISDDRQAIVRLLHFVSLGDPASPNLPGYAMCGYPNIVRRPNPL